MGTGYTRTDTSNNIADGNIINASDFDGEYDAIEAAFNSSTGHTHDGTSAEGGPVTVLGPAQDFVASTTEIKPKTNNTLDIGTTGLKFKNMFLAGTANLVNVTTTGDVTLTGAANNIVFDASDNALEFADSAKATFGADADLQIFHDTSNSIIRDSGTGKLALDGSTVEVRKNDGSEVMAQFVEDGAVSLYHDNSVKLATTATGITVTGSIALDGLHLDDSEKLTFGDSSSPDLEIFHNGSNSFISDTGTGSLVISSNELKIQNAANDEVLAQFTQDGAATLLHNNVTKFATDADGVNVTGQVDISTDLNVGDDVSLTSDAAVINLGADSEVNVTHVADIGILLNVENSTTNGVTDLLKLQVQSSGTPAVGIGTGIEFSTETAAGTLETGGVIESVTTGLTPTSEEFDMVFKTMSSGATAAERLKLNGSGATIGNINVNGNTIISTDTNGNIALTPNGTGEVDITKVDIDSGTIDAVTLGTNSAVTELQVDNINVNGNAITSTDTNGNIALTPNGTGDVQLDADTVRIGDNNANAIITTNGTGDLTLNTNAGSNSGLITIADGANGNIAITPDGTGEVDISKVDIDGGAIDAVTLGTNSAVTQAVIDNININGTTIGHTDDTDLITLADGVVTVAGEVVMTTLDIGGTNITAILDQDDMSSDSATALATQQSIKAFVNNTVGAASNVTATGITFEGATDNDFETTFAITDPTADRTFTFGDESGTVATTVSTSTEATALAIALG